MADLFGDIGRAIEGAARDVGAAVEDVVEDVVNAASSVVTGAGEAVGDVVTDQITSGANVAMGVIEGVKEVFAPGVADAIATVDGARIDLAGGLTSAQAKTDVSPDRPAVLTVEVPTLRANSEVQECLGRLFVGEADGTPEPKGASGMVEQEGLPAKRFAVAVDTPRRPSNVVLSFEGGEAFFSAPGALDAARYDVPDFAAALNAWLDTAAPPAGTPVVLRVVARSDTPGKLGMSVTSLAQHLLQAQLWPGPDGSPSPEVSRDVEFGQTLAFDLDAIADAGGHRQGVTLEVSGAVGDERLLGDVDDVAPTELATVSGEYFVAQRVDVAADTECTGVAARLGAGEEATLYAELCASDADGLPVTSEPLARGEATLAAGTEARWTPIAFETPARLATNSSSWVVLRGVRGTARVALERVATSAPARVNRGGLVWRVIDESRTGARAQVRLLHRPGAANPVAALLLRVEAGPGPGSRASRADPTATPLVVDVAALGTGAARLVVVSRARGNVKLASVMQRYGLADGRTLQIHPTRMAEVAERLLATRLGR